MRKAARILGATEGCLIGIPKVPSVRPRTVTATAAEVEVVIAELQPWMRWCVLLAWDCGLRAGTAINVTAADISSGSIQRRTKRGAGTSIPLSGRLIQLATAAQVLAVNGEPLCMALGCRLTTSERRYKALLGCIRRTQERLRLNGRWRMHDLRRSAAHEMYTRTGDLRKVQALLSHSDLRHTLWYLDGSKTALSGSDMRPYPTPETLPLGKESEDAS